MLHDLSAGIMSPAHMLANISAAAALGSGDTRTRAKHPNVLKSGQISFEDFFFFFCRFHSWSSQVTSFSLSPSCSYSLSTYLTYFSSMALIAQKHEVIEEECRHKEVIQ